MSDKLFEEGDSVPECWEMAVNNGKYNSLFLLYKRYRVIIAALDYFYHVHFYIRWQCSGFRNQEDK